MAKNKNLFEAAYSLTSRATEQQTDLAAKRCKGLLALKRMAYEVADEKEKAKLYKKLGGEEGLASLDTEEVLEDGLYRTSVRFELRKMARTMGLEWSELMDGIALRWQAFQHGWVKEQPIWAVLAGGKLMLAPMAIKLMYRVKEDRGSYYDRLADGLTVAGVRAPIAQETENGKKKPDVSMSKELHGQTVKDITANKQEATQSAELTVEEMAELLALRAAKANAANGTAVH